MAWWFDALMKKTLFVLTFLLLSGTSLAAAIQPPVTYHDERVMGMGNAFTAVADDKNMLFFNPAGFAQYGRKKFSLTDALRDPSQWKPKYKNIPDISLFSLSYRNNVSLFSTNKQAAYRTLINLGIIPVDINSLNSMVDEWNRALNSDPLFTIKKFQTNGAHYGWGNLTPSQLTNLSEAFKTLSQTAMSFNVDSDLFSFTGHYWGFGFFNTFDTSLLFSFQGMLPDLKLSLKNDTIFAAGFGMPWPTMKRLSVGVTFKYFIRVLASANNYDDFINLALYDYSKIGSLLNLNRDIWSLITEGPSMTGKLPDSLFLGTGAGFDLGFMYRLKYGFNLGLQLSDIYTRIRWWDGKQPSLVPINARAGISWKPDFQIWGLFEDPLIAFDIDDLFWQQNNNIWMKTHIGAEFKMLFKIIQVRLGFNQGYPTVGLGIDLSLYFLSKIPLIKMLRPDSIYMPQFNPNKNDFLVHNPLCCLCTGVLSPLLYAHLKLDFLYYTRELGAYAGAIPDSQFAFRVSLSYSY
jgi:hypothetical protein